MRNSTIVRKKKTCASCGKECYWFSNKMCRECATVVSANRRWDAHEEAEEGESLQNLIEDADALFSRYIRLKYADGNGQVRCYTSGRKLPWQQAQCGHFISRRHLGLRWEEANARPQSEEDNCHGHGNLEVFAANLESESPGIVEWLHEQARQVCKPTREEMKELIASLRFKLKIVESKLKK